MAITLINRGEVIEGVVLPKYYTWKWITSTILYSDFKYKIVYNNEIDTYSYNTLGEDVELWSKLSVNDLIKNKLINNFQPKIINIVNNPNSIENYLLEIIPINNDEEDTANSVGIDRRIGIKNLDFDLSFMLNTPTKRLFVDVDTHTYTTNTYATNKGLYGKFLHGMFSNSFESKITKVVYNIHKPNGVVITHELENTITYFEYPNNTDLINTEDLLVEIPVGPRNLRSIVSDATITLPNGFIFIVPNTPMNIENGDYYTYSTWDDTEQTSKEYKIIVKDCSTRYTPIDISWLNESAGFDTFTCYAKNDKTIETKNKIYSHESEERIVGGFFDGYYETLKPRTEEIYQQEIKETYTLYTDYITQEQILNLESLWSSPEVYIDIDGNHLPVNTNMKKVLIKNKKSVGLFQYKIIVNSAVKKYRL